MRKLIVIIAMLFPITTILYGEEAAVSLTDYVTRAEAICVCTVKKDNGDGTVTVRVEKTLKGKLDETVVLKGKTGVCNVNGPVSYFMKPKERYLVFVFKDYIVGRLGGILSIQNETLVTNGIYGFTNTTFDKKQGAHKLSLKKAIDQIRAILDLEDANSTHHVADYLVKQSQLIASIKISKIEIMGKSQIRSNQLRIHGLVQSIISIDKSSTLPKAGEEIMFIADVPLEWTEGKLAYLKEKQKCIVFLKEAHPKQPYWTTVNNWFAIQPYSESLMIFLEGNKKTK